MDTKLKEFAEGLRSGAEVNRGKMARFGRNLDWGRFAFGPLVAF